MVDFLGAGHIYPILLSTPNTVSLARQQTSPIFNCVTPESVSSLRSRANNKQDSACNYSTVTNTDTNVVHCVSVVQYIVE